MKRDLLTILEGDAIAMLKTLPSESVHCCVTSPPYWGLRDYGVEGQIGLEKTPEEFIGKMVEVFRELKRVLRSDGVLWVNIGDSYASGEVGRHDALQDRRGPDGNKPYAARGMQKNRQQAKQATGLPAKNLCMIPARLAIALQSDGWYLRQEIVWSKPNPMPESVTDRCTRSHEMVYMLSKSARYFYDAEAIKEPSNYPNEGKWSQGSKKGYKDNGEFPARKLHEFVSGTSRNRRSVWSIATQPYPESHFAVFPESLVEPMILAGTSERGCCANCGSPYERLTEPTEEYAKLLGKDWSEPEVDNNEGRGHFELGNGQKAAQRPVKRNTPSITASYKTIGWQKGCDCETDDLAPCTVIDTFGGSGTTARVALRLARRAILIELNPKYTKLIEKRCNTTLGLPLSIGALYPPPAARMRRGIERGRVD